MSNTTKIVGAVVVLAAVGYGAYYFMNQKANDVMVEKVNAYLVKNNLQDKVKWEKSEASVAGSASFYNVTLVGDNPDETLKIQQLNVTDLNESEDGGSVALNFTGLSDHQNKSLFLGTAAGGVASEEGLESIGYDQALPLLNGEVKVSYSKKANDLNYWVKLNQEQVFDVTFDLKALETNNLVDTFLEKQSQIEEDPGVLIAPLTPVKISKLEIAFDDKGALAKAKASGGAEEIKLEECQFSLAMMGVSEKANDICQSVIDFTSGTKKTIAFKVNPAQPYPVINLMELGQGGMPDVNKLINELNLSVTN